MNNEEKNLEEIKNEELQEEIKEEQPSELALCKQEAAELKDKLLRATAEFQNTQKRMEKEREQWARFAQVDILSKLLSVVDNVERAMNEAQKIELPQEVATWFDGFKMVDTAFHDYLKKIGVEEIPAGAFNPEFHEAILSVESDQAEGSIVAVLEKGYLFKGQVIRPAKVSVAK